MLRLQGIDFPNDDSVLTPVIRQAIADGSFEAREASGLPRLVRPGERVLELGAGTGFISALLSRLPQVEKIWAVEANPDLLGYMRRLHEMNGCRKIERLNAVLSDSLSGVATFYHRPDFWMGSLLARPNAYTHSSQVPVQGLSAFLAAQQISMIVCDIEGAECDLFAEADLSGVRLVQVEVHDHVTGLGGVQRLIRCMDAKGFLYDPRWSGQSLMVFCRVATPEVLRPYEDTAVTLS